MNTRVLLLQAVLAVCIKQGFSLTCPTCRGADCTQDIKQLECSLGFSPLPWEKSEEKTLSADAEYKCLSLKYGSDDAVTELRQCIEEEIDMDICSELSKHVKVRECFVSKNNLEGSGEDTTPHSTTSEKSPSTHSEPSPSTTSKTSSPDDSPTGPTPKSSSETTPTSPTEASTSKPSSSISAQSSILTLLMAVIVWIHL